MNSLIKAVRWLIGAVTALVLAIAAYFAVSMLLREPIAARAATAHPSFDRQSCIECHSPIAEEWQSSFHFQSLSGPFWQRIRSKGFDDIFRVLEIPCINCHAPANVLDLPQGGHPVERIRALDLGVDCVSCHVSEQGISGPGDGSDAPHEVNADNRFSDPVAASIELCGHCHEETPKHARVVSEWRETDFAARGVTCLHCHMPRITAPSITGGPSRTRRDHTFRADKDPDMLRRAVELTLNIDGRGFARVTIENVGAGHSVPASGLNSIIARVRVHDGSGNTTTTLERTFGTIELLPGYLDFWPFQQVSKIPPGAVREIEVDLPASPGTVSVELRYRDWFAIKDRDVIFAESSQDF